MTKPGNAKGAGGGSLPDAEAAVRHIFDQYFKPPPPDAAIQWVVSTLHWATMAPRTSIAEAFPEIPIEPPGEPEELISAMETVARITRRQLAGLKSWIAEAPKYGRDATGPSMTEQMQRLTLLARHVEQYIPAPMAITPKRIGRPAQKIAETARTFKAAIGVGFADAGIPPPSFNGGIGCRVVCDLLTLVDGTVRPLAAIRSMLRG
jgi:hypothetical protein